jgi:hypothetical protein
LTRRRWRQAGAAGRGRHLAHHHRAGPEAVDDQAAGGKLLGMGGQPLGGRGIEIDDLGHQQRLGGDAGAVARRLEALIDQPLVGGMGIDDHQPVAGLGENVVVVHLRPAAPSGQSSASGAAGPGATATGASKPANAAACSPKPPPWPWSRRARPFGSGRKARAAALASGVAVRCPAAASASLHRPDQQPAHQAGVAEPHLGLGRMHVDVDLFGRAGRNSTKAG